MQHLHYAYFLFLLLIGSCNLVRTPEFSFEPSYAIPLLNDQIKVQDILSQSEGASFSIDQDGKVNLLYKAGIIEESISEILPSISSIGEVPIIDTVSQFPLTTANNFILNKAIFSGDEMRFRYSTALPSDITVKMKIPELTKDGVIFEDNYTLTYTGTAPYTSFTESIPLDGWEFNSESNLLTFIYDARTPQGERIKLDFAAMSFNQLDFAYGEGSVERNEYELKVQNVPINVFDAWRSGTLEFNDPELRFILNHSFGFPISLRINNVSIALKDGSIKNLSGINLGNELKLNFPKINEVGESASTEFKFDKSNSNINVLFNEKATSFSYDIDAVLNPTGDLDLIGFVTEDSQFDLQVEVALPLEQRIDQLLLSDTISIEPIDARIVKEAELKIISENSYPSTLEVSIEFLDEENQPLFSLFDDDPLSVSSGILNSDGTTTPSEEVIRFVTLPQSSVDKLGQASKIVVTPKFDSSTISEDFLTIFEDQFLEMRIGLILQL